MKLLILSDVHIGKTSEEGQSALFLFRHIAERYDHRSTVIAFTGDLTDDASLPQIKVASDLISKFRRHGFTVFAVPGNHDRGFSGLVDDEERISAWETHIAGGWPQIHQKAGWRFLLLNTANDSDFMAQGKLGHDQLAFLAVELSDKAPMVILMHHKPWWRNPTLLLADADAFLAFTRRAQGPLVVVCGHKHERAVWRDKDGASLALSAGRCTEKKTGAPFWKRLLRLAKWHLEYEEIDLSSLEVRVIRASL